MASVVYTFKGTYHDTGTDPDAVIIPVDFHMGIPAHDLTDEDVGNMTEEEIALVESSDLYSSAAAPSRGTLSGPTAEPPKAEG
jgi:hypothetical protein